MHPLSDRTVSRLKIEEAIEAEAVAERNLLPTEFSWASLVENKQKVASWISSRLRSGFVPAPQHVTTIRKVQGTRPAAVWGVAERIVYRALTDAALGRSFKLDRSPEAYVKFVKAPVEFSQELQHQSGTGGSLAFFFFRSDIRYVVKSDITAFYQYIDHSILARELAVLGADYDTVDALLELLQAVQGRAYGLPQMYDTSDMLSEVYIDRLERDALRSGLNVWRYNDDFRIACRTYEETLVAVECLDAAARNLGLVVSESKTLTYGFLKYMTDSLNIELSPGQEQLTLDDVEAAVGDYTGDFSDDVEAALEVIKSAVDGKAFTEDSTRAINIRKITTTDLRLLQRAINSLSGQAAPQIIDQVLPLVVYVPALFPTLMRYMHAMYKFDPDAVARSFDLIIENASMNEWQHQWLIQEIHELGLLSDESAGDRDKRVAWVSDVSRGHSNASAAYGTRALAACDKIAADELVRRYESSPTSFLPWYLEALAARSVFDKSDSFTKRLTSIGSESPVHKSLTGDNSA